MTRGQRLRRHMTDLGLTTHGLATALSVPRVSVQAALRDRQWFTPATERRLNQFLEVPRTEFAILD